MVMVSYNTFCILYSPLQLKNMCDITNWKDFLNFCWILTVWYITLMRKVKETALCAFSDLKYDLQLAISCQTIQPCWHGKETLDDGRWGKWWLWWWWGKWWRQWLSPYCYLSPFPPWATPISFIFTPPPQFTTIHSSTLVYHLLYLFQTLSPTFCHFQLTSLQTYPLLDPMSILFLTLNFFYLKSLLWDRVTTIFAFFSATCMNPCMMWGSHIALLQQETSAYPITI